MFVSGFVIWQGHIPYSFFEEQMHAYFSQFGQVTRLRLSRSKKVHAIGLRALTSDARRLAAVSTTPSLSSSTKEGVLRCFQ